MVGATTATYAGAYHALDRLAAAGDVTGSRGFTDDVVTSLMIVSGAAVPSELLHPPTAITVAVALEVLTGLFLLVVAILAFTIGSAQHAEEIKSAFGQRYGDLSAKCVEDLRMLAPSWDIETELAVAQENIRAVMKAREPRARHAKLPEQDKAARRSS